MTKMMESLIIKYLSNTITEEEKTELLGWLQENEDNKKLFVDNCNIWLAANDILVSEGEVEDALDRLRNNIALYERKNKKASQRFSLQRVAVAAVLLIAAFSVGSFFLGKNSYSEPEMVMYHSFVTGHDSKDSLTLSDGTVVWMNKDSKLSFVGNFEGKERSVKLEGGAFFNVAKNAKKPFIVESGNVKIKVLGTRFDVKNYEDHADIEASLLSGEVEVYIEGDSKGIKLRPTERIVINKQSNKVEIKNFDTVNQTIWTRNEIVFSDDKLSDILEKIGYWYGIDIVTEGTLNLQQKLSFTVRNETKEELFSAISLIAPIRYEISNEKVIVRAK